MILANYFAVNEEHLRLWSPLMPLEHHSIAAWRQRLYDREESYQKGHSVHFIGTDATESFMIGSCTLSNIVQGVSMAGNIGYSVAHRYEGRGYMRRIVIHAIDYAFNTLKLHRLCSSDMPANVRSDRLLQRLNFEKEGYVKQYLYINGHWEDHVLNALINSQEE